MIDHVSIGVRDLDAAAVFYDAVLATIGLRKLVVRGTTVGFGKKYLAQCAAPDGSIG